jgi:hypothetical protein
MELRQKFGRPFSSPSARPPCVRLPLAPARPSRASASREKNPVHYALRTPPSLCPQPYTPHRNHPSRLRTPPATPSPPRSLHVAVPGVFILAGALNRAAAAARPRRSPLTVLPPPGGPSGGAPDLHEWLRPLICRRAAPLIYRPTCRISSPGISNSPPFLPQISQIS